MLALWGGLELATQGALAIDSAPDAALAVCSAFGNTKPCVAGHDAGEHNAALAFATTSFALATMVVGSRFTMAESLYGITAQRASAIPAASMTVGALSVGTRPMRASTPEDHRQRERCYKQGAHRADNVSGYQSCRCSSCVCRPLSRFRFGWLPGAADSCQKNKPERPWHARAGSSCVVVYALLWFTRCWVWWGSVDKCTAAARLRCRLACRLR